MLASVSRGMESLRKSPPPARISISVSDRYGVQWEGGACPLPAAFRQLFEAASLGPANWPERMSVPITRIVCGLTARRGLPCSVLPMSVSFHFWICDEISKARKLSRIQASAAIPTHLRTRRHGGRTAGSFLGARRGGAPLSPLSPLPPTRSRTFDRSGDRRRRSRPGRDR